MTVYLEIIDESMTYHTAWNNFIRSIHIEFAPMDGGYKELLEYQENVLMERYNARLVRLPTPRHEYNLSDCVEFESEEDLTLFLLRYS